MNVNTASVLEQHAANMQGVATLGNVVWFKVPDLSIRPGQIASAAASAGLAVDDVPTLCHPNDAFRRATSTLKGKGKDFRVIVRPVSDDTLEIVRVVVVERVKRAAHGLEHESVAGRFTFRKDTGQMNCSRVSHNLAAAEIAEVDRLLVEGQQLFQRFTTELAGNDVRNWMMRRLKKLQTIAVHPDGRVYFVPRSNVEEAERLSAFVANLAPYVRDNADAVLFASVPLPRDPQQERVVEAGFRNSMASEMNQMIGEVADLLGKQGDEYKGATVEGKIEEVAELRRRATEYARLLGIGVSEIETQLELVDAQLEELLTRNARAAAKKRRR